MSTVWIVWIVLGLGLELFALATGRITLSQVVWRWLGYRLESRNPFREPESIRRYWTMRERLRSDRTYKWRRLVLFLFLVWLPVHLLTGGWV